MPFSELCLIVSLIFAIINVWPFWNPSTAPWRPTAFAISWLFFILWLVLGHGGVALNR
jgi:hypothetical protein